MRRTSITTALLSIVLGTVLVGSPAAAAGPKLFMVTNNSGDPLVPGSLPWAVKAANYTNPGLDYIRFNLPSSSGGVEIPLNEPLWINDTVDVSAPYLSSPSGPQITLRGNNLPVTIVVQSDPSIGVTASGSTISGFGIIGFTDAAITIAPQAQGVFVQNNTIGYGLVSGGTTTINNWAVVPADALPDGMEVQSSFNTIRWNRFTSIDYGVILGGDRFGTSVSKTNSIQGNAFYGTDLLSGGVLMGPGAQENFIGPGNEFLNHPGVGIEVFSNTATRNVIFSNRLFSSRMLGIVIGNQASGNTIGGPFGGNAIAAEVGVMLGWGDTRSATYTWVEGNEFWDSHTYPASYGVVVQAGSFGNYVGRNTFDAVEYGIVVGDNRSRGTGRNSFNDNTFGRCYGSTSPVGRDLTFSYSNNNFATGNLSLSPDVTQRFSRGNVIGMGPLVCPALNSANPALRVSAGWCDGVE